MGKMIGSLGSIRRLRRLRRFKKENNLWEFVDRKKNVAFCDRFALIGVCLCGKKTIPMLLVLRYFGTSVLLY